MGNSDLKGADGIATGANNTTLSETLSSRQAEELRTVSTAVPPSEKNGSTVLHADEAYEATSLEQTDEQSIPEIDKIRQNASSKSLQSNIAKKLSYNIDTMTVLDLDDFTQTTNFTSTQSFHTIPLDTPGPENSLRNSSDFKGQSTREAEPAIAAVRSDGVSEGLPPISERPNADSRIQQAHNTVLVPLHEEDDSRDREKHVSEVSQSKPLVTHLPSIGAPSPLRKSLRAPREIQKTTTYPSMSSKPTNTRSSWLVKAREAKAMEASTRHAVATASVLPSHSSAGMKRKSGEMLGIEPTEGEVGRTQKLTRVAETSHLLSILTDQNKPSLNSPHELTRTDLTSLNNMHADPDTRMMTHEDAASEEGMIDRLKKTVAGFNQRTGKSMGMSLGGAAADALAARQAAEAKIAERHAAESGGAPTAAMPADASPNTDKAAATPLASQQQPLDVEAMGPTTSAERRFSMSELVMTEPKKDTLRERVFQPPPKSVPQTIEAVANASVSTTPPHSPPAKHLSVFSAPEKPKPPPTQVFFPPAAGTAISRDSNRPSNHELRSHAVPAQSSQSTFVDPIFDHDQQMWGPSTQDTEIEDSHPPGLQVQKSKFSEPTTDMDADESWHLDDKYGEVWSPVAMKDDSMTWSTAPTRSTRAGDTDRMNVVPTTVHSEPTVPEEQDTPEDPRNSGECDMDIEDSPDLGAIRLVTPAKPTLFSVGATDSTLVFVANLWQSHKETTGLTAGGFLNSATKFVTSVLGGSKKGKEPVKSIQMAAAAAKKVCPRVFFVSYRLLNNLDSNKRRRIKRRFD